MDLSRRDFLKASSTLAAAFGLHLPEGDRAVEAAGASGPSVVWLQGHGCSGCSVSLLNSISLASAADLLTTTLSMEYHSTLMASAGAKAVAQAVATQGKGGYVLCVDGGVSTAANGQYCTLWPGMTALNGVKIFAQKAAFILAIGSCSSYGGMCGGKPNPTGIQPLSSIVGTTKLINIAGCPTHPDWIVGTIAWLIKYGSMPALDAQRRPQMYFGQTVHSMCPYRDDFGEDQCLWNRGCRGPFTHGDCPRRKWNAGAAGGTGVNWCVGVGSPYGTPCHGCTEPDFPDAASPFFVQHGSFAGGEGGYDRSATTQPAPQTTQTTQPTLQTQAAPQPAASGQQVDLSQLNDSPETAPTAQGKAARRAAYDRLKQQKRREYEERKAAARAKQ